MIPSIPEFYIGRKILITGGTGFMGKVLIEQLLRSCPDLHTIYLLIRPKKGKRPEDRIQDITRQALFDTLRRNEPGAFQKLRAVSGDVKELGLGLNAEDRHTLQRQVSVVFHAAATVRFTGHLNDAVLMNVRGTREVVNLALGMDNLQVFLHLSTAFSNSCDQGHVEEKMYPAPNGWDWKTAIKLAEMKGTDGYVNLLTPKILGPMLPNSYVFTKALGEQLVNDHRDRLPLVIVRPSIVVGAFDEPITGWIDNTNGPYGIWTGSYAGVVRTLLNKESVFLDFVPVDGAVKSVIVIAWHRAVSNLSTDSELPVYNCTTLLEPQTQGIFHADLTQTVGDYPTTKMIWYPKGKFTESWTYFYVNFLLFHVAYGILADAILEYKNLKPMFVKIYRRFYTGVVELHSFMFINYTFDNTAFRRVADDLLASDRKAFGYTDVRPMNRETLKTIVLGMREYILHDPIKTLPEARRKMARLFWLDAVIRGAFWLALFWALSNTSVVRSVAALFAQ